MKTLLKKMTSLLPGGLALATALVTGSVQTSQAASADPSAGSSFTWDLASTGSGQRGIAFITFSNDLTFRGYQLNAAIPANTNSVKESRGGDDSRGDDNSGGGGNKTNNLVFGFTPINGVWQFNSKGQIVGFFSVALNVTSTVTNFQAGTVLENIVNSQTSETTNILVGFAAGEGSKTVSYTWPNPPGYSQSYTFENPNFTVGVGSAETTNTISFTGKANGKHLTLLCNSSFGKVTFKGVPAVPSVDISGSWIGDKRVGGLQSTEFFNLVPFSAGNPFASEFPDIASFPNAFFTTNGIGAGYDFTGVALFSQHKTIGFTFVKGDGTMRSTVGSLKAKRFGATANTVGIEEPKNRVNFTATLQ